LRSGKELPSEYFAASRRRAIGTIGRPRKTGTFLLAAAGRAEFLLDNVSKGTDGSIRELGTFHEQRAGVGLHVASGPKTTLRRNPISEQDFGRPLVASFWSSKSDFWLGLFDFKMTLQP
jgi:hypothetical protein